jgi:hypothetical protein
MLGSKLSIEILESLAPISGANVAMAIDYKHGRLWKQAREKQCRHLGVVGCLEVKKSLKWHLLRLPQ